MAGLVLGGRARAEERVRLCSSTFCNLGRSSCYYRLDFSYSVDNCC